MKKLITGVLSAVLLSAMLCACGCEDGRLDPSVTNTPDATNMPDATSLPDAAKDTPMGQSDGMTNSDGMQQ